MAPPPAVIRPLGKFEQFFSSRHSLGLHKSVVTVCRYAVPAALEGDAQQVQQQVQARVEAALAVVVGRLGALRACIVGEDTRQPQFVAAESLELREHMEWRVVGGEEEEEDDDVIGGYDRLLERELEKESARPWSDLVTHPSWRLLGFFFSPSDAAGRATARPLRHVDLAFAVHHVLADGKSGQVFHAHLVEALNEGQLSEAPPPTAAVLRFDSPPRLAPPQEQLIRFTISWGFFARTLWNELAPAWLRRLAAWLLPGARGLRSASSSDATLLPYDGDQPIALVLRPTRVCLLSVAPADVAALVGACRAHGTTLTPLLHALLAAASARRLSAAEAATFSGTTPISLRNHVTKQQQQQKQQKQEQMQHIDIQRTLGNFVSSYRHVFSLNVVQGLREGEAAAGGSPDSPDGPLWRAVAEVDAGLRTCTADVTRDSLMGLMAWIRDWHAWLRSKDGMGRADTWEVSNVGAMEDGSSSSSSSSSSSRNSSWRITRAFFTFTAPAMGPLLEITASSVRGGPLTLAMVRQQGSVDEERFCEGVWADLRASLARFVKKGSFLGGPDGGEVDEEADGEAGGEADAGAETETESSVCL